MPIPTATLPHTVTIEAYAGEGASGPSWSTAGDSVRCRIIAQRRTVRTRDGVDTTSSASIRFRPDVTITAGSRVTHGSDTFIVLDVAAPAELTQAHSTVVLVEGPR